MHRNFTTIPHVNKVKILFTKRQMTAYGGFPSSHVSEQIGFAQRLNRRSYHGISKTAWVYGKAIAFVQ